MHACDRDAAFCCMLVACKVIFNDYVRGEGRRLDGRCARGDSGRHTGEARLCRGAPAALLVVAAARRALGPEHTPAPPTPDVRSTRRAQAAGEDHIHWCRPWPDGRGQIH